MSCQDVGSALRGAMKTGGDSGWRMVPCAGCGVPTRKLASLCDEKVFRNLAHRNPFCPECFEKSVAETYQTATNDIRAKTTQILLEHSRAPVFMPPPTSERWCPEFQAVISGRRTGLIVLGPVGIGKTVCAAETIRKWCAQRAESALYFNEGDLFSALRDEEAPIRAKTLSQLQRSRLLIIDDMGTRKATDWRASVYFDVLDERYARRLATILVTNLEVDELLESAMFDHRVIRRMLELCGQPFEMKPINGPIVRRVAA